MPTNTPTGPATPRSTAPETAEGTPAHPGPALFGARLRGRHRKPRPRKLLLAGGGLALTAGALSLVRLASGPGPADLGTEAGSGPVVPDPSTTTSPGTGGADGTAGAAAPAAPQAGPSSPTALGGRSTPPLLPAAPGGTTAPTAEPPPLSPPAVPEDAPRTPNTPDTPGAPKPPVPTGAPPGDPT
ncbi:hypothetical protein, partial [Streptomyces prasinus]